MREGGVEVDGEGRRPLALAHALDLPLVAASLVFWLE